ncbi:MAG: ABC transporter permease [bacterium]|nr:ABC transporter permease [bacterium]
MSRALGVLARVLPQRSGAPGTARRARHTLRALGRGALAHKGLTVGFVVILLILLAGFFAPLPHDPIQPNPENTLQSPDGEFWFGTDRFGFDVFSRVFASARLDLPIALAGTLLSIAVGIPVGLVASNKSRWSERIMRGLDMFQSFPLLVLAFAIVALTGNTLRNIIFAIALVNVPRFIRLVRSEALVLRESRFIEAATAIGASRTRVMLRHVMPNTMGIVLAQASLAAAHAIIVIAGLSFLGIGITPPEASWGVMIRVGSQNIATGQWWVSFFPGAMVFVTIVAFNMVADGVTRLIGRAED